MAYIGLISDTHGIFDGRVKEFLQPVDQIWHAGDFGNVQTMDSIAAFKPLVGVYGNCDDQTIRRCQPYTQSFTLEGMKILMMHIGGYPFRYDYKALQLIYALQPDIFVCGHSHILRVMNDKKFNMLVMNPGAAGVMGMHTLRTALRFKIESGTVKEMEVGEWPKSIIHAVE